MAYVLSSVALVLSVTLLSICGQVYQFTDTTPCPGSSGASVDVVVSANPSIPASNGVIGKLLLIRFTQAFNDTTLDFSGTLSFRLCANARYRVALSLDETKKDALYASVGNADLALQVSLGTQVVGTRLFNATFLEIAFSTPPVGRTAADCNIDALIITDRPSSVSMISLISDWNQFNDDTPSESIFNAENLCAYQTYQLFIDGAQSNLIDIQEVNFRGFLLSQNTTQFSFSAPTPAPTLPTTSAPTTSAPTPATNAPSAPSPGTTTPAPAQNRSGVNPLHLGVIIVIVLVVLLFVSVIVIAVIQRRRRKYKLQSSSTELATDGLVSKGAKFQIDS